MFVIPRGPWVGNRSLPHYCTSPMAPSYFVNMCITWGFLFVADMWLAYLQAFFKHCGQASVAWLIVCPWQEYLMYQQQTNLSVSLWSFLGDWQSSSPRECGCMSKGKPYLVAHSNHTCWQPQWVSNEESHFRFCLTKNLTNFSLFWPNFIIVFYTRRFIKCMCCYSSFTVGYTPPPTFMSSSQIQRLLRKFRK